MLLDAFMKLRFIADILTFMFIWNLFYPWIIVPLAIFSFGAIKFVPQFKLVYFSLLCLILLLDFSFFSMKVPVTSIFLIILGTAAFQNWGVGLVIGVFYFVLTLIFRNKRH